MKKNIFFIIILITITTSLFISYPKPPDEELYVPSVGLANYQQDNFQDYIDETRT
jgi:hypothetical protein